MSDAVAAENRVGADAPPRLAVTVFTDPLCCWSWAFEPQIRALRYAHAGRIAWRTRMGGMIGDWNGFEDPVNAVARPGQMGPLWVHAAEVSGMPMAAAIWVEDPPAGSHPPSLAVKTAERQSARAGDLMLRRLREALMMHGRNIARQSVILDVAAAVARDRPDLLDLDRFVADLAGRAAAADLEADVREARYLGARRFPSLMLQRPGAAPAWLVGWRPGPALGAAFREIAGDLGPERRPESPEAYARYWGGALDREIEEAVAPGGADA